MRYRDVLEVLRNFILLTQQSPDTTGADIRVFADQALREFGFSLDSPIPQEEK